MPFCSKHGQVYGEGCTCTKCDAAKKAVQTPTTNQGGSSVPRVSNK